MVSTQLSALSILCDDRSSTQSIWHSCTYVLALRWAQGFRLVSCVWNLGMRLLRERPTKILTILLWSSLCTDAYGMVILWNWALNNQVTTNSHFRIMPQVWLSPRGYLNRSWNTSPSFYLQLASPTLPVVRYSWLIPINTDVIWHLIQPMKVKSKWDNGSQWEDISTHNFTTEVSSAHRSWLLFFFCGVFAQ